MKKYCVEWFIKPEELEETLNHFLENGYEILKIDTYYQNNDRGNFLYYSVVFEKEELK